MNLIYERDELEALLGILLIIFLAVVILTGRVIYDINKSSSSSDPRISNAKKWANWGIGISVIGSIIAIVGIVVLFVLAKKGELHDD